MKPLSFLIIAISLFVLISAGSAKAQSIVPRSASYSMADDQSIDDEDVVQSYFHKDRSYECAILALDFATSGTDEYYVFNTSVTDPDGSPLVASTNGDDYPAIAPVDGVEAVHDRARISVVAQKTGIYKFSVMDAFGNNNSESSTIRCRETTLYGGYNRFFAGVAIVELNNASEKGYDVSFDIIDAQGQKIIDAQEATAKANTRTDVIFANLPAASFGQIRITHNAPFGAIQGTVAEYDFNSDGSIVLKRERRLSNAQRR